MLSSFTAHKAILLHNIGLLRTFLEDLRLDIFLLNVGDELLKIFTPYFVLVTLNACVEKKSVVVTGKHMEKRSETELI